MKHFDHTNKTRAERTSSDWLAVGASIAQYANEVANRNDIVTFVGEGATDGLAPALFKPDIAEIEINVEKAFGFGVKPNHIGAFSERGTRYEFPVATGAILHEAFHARFSRWSIEEAHKELKADEFEALMLLEESRIEAQGLMLDTRNRNFLRSCAMELVLSEVTNDELDNLTVKSAAKLFGLLHARVIAGVFTADEVADVTQTLRLKLSENVFIRLCEIADEYQKHTQHWNITSAYPLAIEWAKLIRDTAEEQGEQQQPSEGEGEGSDKGMSEAGKELLKKLIDLADDVEISSASELYDQETKEEWEEILKASKADAKERQTNKEISEEVFGRGTEEISTLGTFSTLAETRKPTPKERSAAVIISKMLERAKYRDRDVTEVTSQVPQGRLRTSAALQNDALRAVGQMPTAKPWKRKVRKQTEEPKLTVGVMVDISGSMNAAMEPMATTAWVMSEAVRRVQGRAAMVYYGNDVFPTLKAGQHLTDVQVFSARDSTEKFDKAFKALDGSLNLLYGDGARLLVVVSDGVYTDAETRAARKWVQRCQQQGVAVMWLPFDHGSYVNSICKGSNAVVLEGRLSPADAAVEIGRAAAQALGVTSAARV